MYLGETTTLPCKGINIDWCHPMCSCLNYRSDGTVNSIEGVAKVKEPSQPAVLSVSFFKGTFLNTACIF